MSNPSRLELLAYIAIAAVAGLLAYASWPEPAPKSPQEKAAVEWIDRGLVRHGKAPEKLTHSQERDTTRP